MSELEWPATVTVSSRAKLDFDDIDDPAMRATILAALGNDLKPSPQPPKIVLVESTCWPEALLLTVPDPDFWNLYYYQVVDAGGDVEAGGEINIEDYLVLYRNLTAEELAAAARLGRPSVRYRVARILPRSQFSVPFPEV